MNKIICFHNPEEENGYLSNWYLSDFELKGKKFSSMEQYMMFSKAMLFGDEVSAREIMNTSDVGKIKALGRGVKHYNDIIWNGMRQLVIYEGLMAKFSQNESLKKKLLGTGNAILAECAVQDKIWGIGCSMKEVNRLDMTKWKGQNLLGFALMKVRTDLCEQC